MNQVIPTISQDITNRSAISLMGRKMKNAKVFFKINISTILLYLPSLPLNIFLSYFNLSGNNCDTYEHTRTFAFMIGPMWCLHLFIFPIIQTRKLRRFYSHVITQALDALICSVLSTRPYRAWLQLVVLQVLLKLLHSFSYDVF